MNRSVPESSFKLLVQSIVDYAIYMLDPDGRVTSWNAGAERIKGFAAEEITGQHFSRFYTDEDRAAGVPHTALETARTQGKYEAEGWRVRKDGSRFWASVVIDAIKTDDGQLVGFAKITRDMTDKKVAQEALLDAERHFRILVQGVTDYAIYMLDPEGHVTSWNAGAQRIKGYAPDEIVGSHFSRFYTPEDSDGGVPGTALKTARSNGRYEAEGWRMRKDGTRFWASVVIDAIHDDAGQLIGFAKITRDMTEKRETQLRLEESREQLFRSQKMEALGQLTGGLAHDFNNLLTAILGGSDLALRNLHDAGKLKRMLDGIRSSAQRGAGLTKQLLAFARAQALDIRQIDLRPFLDDAVTLLRPSLRTDIEVVLETPDQLWSADADAGALELALLNLAFNARDAMPDGGTLRISASNQLLDGHPEGLRGEHVALRVADTGTGMSRETMDHVFEPFFTTKKYGEGTGLGLSQVFGFAKQLGGALELESELGEGSTFTIYLPASRGAQDVAAPRQPGKTALGRVLVFSDVLMPGGISGIELAGRVRSRFPELPVLLTTGYSQEVGGSHGFPVLQKPYELTSLASALSDLLKREITVD